MSRRTAKARKNDEDDDDYASTRDDPLFVALVNTTIINAVETHTQRPYAGVGTVTDVRIPREATHLMGRVTIKVGCVYSPTPTRVGHSEVNEFSKFVGVFLVFSYSGKQTKIPNVVSDLFERVGSHDFLPKLNGTIIAVRDEDADSLRGLSTGSRPMLYHDADGLDTYMAVANIPGKREEFPLRMMIDSLNRGSINPLRLTPQMNYSDEFIETWKEDADSFADFFRKMTSHPTDAPTLFALAQFLVVSWLADTLHQSLDQLRHDINTTQPPAGFTPETLAENIASYYVKNAIQFIGQTDPVEATAITKLQALTETPAVGILDVDAYKTEFENNRDKLFGLVVRPSIRMTGGPVKKPTANGNTDEAFREIAINFPWSPIVTSAIILPATQRREIFGAAIKAVCASGSLITSSSSQKQADSIQRLYAGTASIDEFFDDPVLALQAASVMLYAAGRDDLGKKAVSVARTFLRGDKLDPKIEGRTLVEIEDALETRITPVGRRLFASDAHLKNARAIMSNAESFGAIKYAVAMYAATVDKELLWSLAIRNGRRILEAGIDARGIRTSCVVKDGDVGFAAHTLTGIAVGPHIFEEADIAKANLLELVRESCFVPPFAADALSDPVLLAVSIDRMGGSPSRTVAREHIIAATRAFFGSRRATESERFTLVVAQNANMLAANAQQATGPEFLETALAALKAVGADN